MILSYITAPEPLLHIRAGLYRARRSLIVQEQRRSKGVYMRSSLKVLFFYAVDMSRTVRLDQI